MCEFTVGMLVWQPVMFSSFMFIQLVPDFTLFLPERNAQEINLQKHTDTNKDTQYDTRWQDTTQPDLGSVYGHRQLSEVMMDWPDVS